MLENGLKLMTEKQKIAHLLRRFGLGADALVGMRGSSSHLHVGSDALDGPCHAVPWPNLLSGATQPVITRAEPCTPWRGLT